MDRPAVTALIDRRIREFAASKDVHLPPIAPDTPLFEGALPIDSLDLAALVVELEIATGVEPFRDGLVEFRTVGDLAALFAQHA
jgi:acyl carrier protein